MYIYEAHNVSAAILVRSVAYKPVYLAPRGAQLSINAIAVSPLKVTFARGLLLAGHRARARVATYASQVNAHPVNAGEYATR